jgi:hypothetical protein
LVYRTIQAAGGPTAVLAALGVAEATLKRWRRAGVVSDARGVLVWAALVHPGAPEAQLKLARRLAGLPAVPVLEWAARRSEKRRATLQRLAAVPAGPRRR